MDPPCGRTRTRTRHHPIRLSNTTHPQPVIALRSSARSLRPALHCAWLSGAAVVDEGRRSVRIARTSDAAARSSSARGRVARSFRPCTSVRAFGAERASERRRRSADLHCSRRHFGYRDRRCRTRRRIGLMATGFGGTEHVAHVMRDTMSGGRARFSANGRPSVWASEVDRFPHNRALVRTW
jgi:hypothetical protein